MTGKAVMTAVASLMMSAAAAESSVTIKRVTQRWPWNNKVDIEYTVSGGQDVEAGVFCRLVFTANVDGVDYIIDGVHDVGANAGTTAEGESHIVTWTPPAGLKAANCKMTAKLYKADNPSGDDYMVIDLLAGTVSYEGLLASQESSNDRYNRPLYKTDKMVLRKVPAGGEYPTGDDSRADNTRRIWKTDRDYYIGVFLVTQSQFEKFGQWGNSSHADNKVEVEGNEVAHRPVDQVTWTAARGEITEDVPLLPVDPVPPIASAAWNTKFLQRLNLKTGNRFNFDLPTEVMLEIAIRAGTTSTFFWGEDWKTLPLEYTVCTENSGDKTVAVGSRAPNGWGIFDAVGNVYVWCLDDDSRANLADAPDPWTPACNGSSTNRRLRGGCFKDNAGWGPFKSFTRTSMPWNRYQKTIGLRIACIVK